MNKPRQKSPTALALSNRVRLLLVLLCIGIAGILVVFFFRHLSNIASQHVAEVATYANKGVITNLTEIFQIPALMFFGVLVAYCVHELYKSYQAMNDPETYRNRTSRGVDVGNVAGRKAKRAETQKKPSASKAAARLASASQAKKERKRKTPLTAGRLPYIKDETELPKMTDVTKIPSVTGVKEKD